jgi:hypothetical protein
LSWTSTFLSSEPHFSAINASPVMYSLIYAFLRAGSGVSKFRTQLAFCWFLKLLLYKTMTSILRSVNAGKRHKKASRLGTQSLFRNLYLMNDVIIQFIFFVLPKCLNSVVGTRLTWARFKL